MVKAIYSAKLLVASCILMLPVFSFAQIGSAARNDLGQKMEEGESNFTSFTSQSIRNIQHWDNNNSEDFKAHPEYGILPLNAPCSECVEVLEKRTANERYFVEINDYNKFYIQKSIGDLHRIIGNRWITIDHKLKSQGNNIYESPNQIEPIGLDLNQNYTYIKTSMGYLRFNNWSLYGEKDGVQTLISKANWSNRTVGEDGVKIKDIFPGMDAEMVVYRGSVKTNFIIKKNYNKQYDNIIFKDDFSHPTGGNFQFEEYPDVNRAVGTLLFKNNFGELAKVNPAIIYPKNGNKKDAEEAPYLINTNSMGVVVAVDWIEKYIGNYEIVVDPLVTGTNTLAQASIAGSGYNATCFVGFCPYFLSVNAPANAQFTNVLWSFTYIAQGLCWLNEGAVDFRLGACRSPGQANFFWFCNQTGGGTCTGTNIPIFNDISPCLPNPACVQQAVNFEMRFYRCFSAGAGCSNACIGANSPWIMTIQGMTIEYQSPVNPITVSATTICNGQIINASTSAQYGVTPYTYNWSFNPAGTPSVGTGANTTISFPGPGSYTLYSLVTDACGNTVTNSVGITVNPTPVATATPSSQTICSGQNTAIALSSTVGGTTYSWTVVQSGVSGAASGSGSNINQTLSTTGAAQGTATYTITPVANGCTGTPITVTVTVNPTPTATATPTSQTICSGQTTGINLTSNVAGTTFNWTVTQTGVSGAAAGSGATIAQTLTATGGAAGTATYTITPTANGCTGTPIIVTVTVNPTPDAIATPASQTICSGQNTGINLTSSVAGTTFNWTVTQTGVSGATAGTGSTITQALTTTAAAQGTATYTITPSLGGCAGTPISVTVSVNPSEDATFAYNPTTFCLTSTNPTPTVTTPGGTFSGVGVVFVSTSTGEIDLASTGVGTYTVTYTTGGPCPATSSVTITITSAPDASFSFAASYCQNVSNPLPTFPPGASAGTFSSSPAGLVIDASTGEINLSASTPGTYTITNTIAAAGGCAPATANTTVVVNPVDDATFAYGGITFCQTGTNPQANITGLAGGLFSETSGTPGLVLNPSTGEIDLAGSSLGTYDVTYTTNGSCPSSSTVTITITSSPSANFTYSSTSYCNNSSNQLPGFGVGASAGVFSSSPAGLSINTTTGEINVGTSTPGIYTVTNFIAASGGCASATSTFTVEILSLDDATFSYSASTYCTSDVNQSPVISGLVGGTFTVTSGIGLDINASTGVVNPSGSSLGTYTITYTTNGPCPTSATFNLTIVDQQDATITPIGPFCNYDNPIGLIAANTGGTWSGPGVDPNTGIFNPTTAGSGTHTIVYTILGSCGDTDQITITVGGPNASFTANPSVGPAPLNVQYSNASSGSGLTYDWDFGDGNVSTSQNPSNTFGALGSYTTTLIVTDALGCSDTASIIISVVGETIVLIPNIFSPNGDGINDIFKITTVNVTSMEGFVFNRWGQELFSWTDLNGGWNGKTPKGDNASDGTYFYIIKIKTALDEEKEYTGSFSLIR